MLINGDVLKHKNNGVGANALVAEQKAIVKSNFDNAIFFNTFFDAARLLY
jgi:hypothetical protein